MTKLETTARWFHAAYEATRPAPKTWEGDHPEARRGYLLLAKLHLEALAVKKPEPTLEVCPRCKCYSGVSGCSCRPDSL